MPRVRVNGTRLYYERARERRAAAADHRLHDQLGASSSRCSTLYDGRFECIVYDNRGSGRCGSPLRPTSMAELAADAAGLLRELGVESAHVYGLSMGGMIAQELAIRFPERVRGLVLGGTTPGGPRAARPTLRELGALGRRPRRAALGDGRPWLAMAVLGRVPRASSPSASASCCATSAATARRRRASWSHWWASVYHDTLSRLRLHPGADARHARRARRDGADLQRAPAGRADPGRRAARSSPGAGHAYLLERPEASLRRCWPTGSTGASPIAPGAPRTGVAARAEPLTRALGLPIGAARTGASLAGAMTDRLRRRSAHVATDR